MRTVFLAWSLMFAMFAGCITLDGSPSQASQSDEVSAVGLSCPTICGEGTLCHLPSGSCTEVCNPCFCTVRGGTVVTSCPAAAAPAAPVEDIVIGGGACGSTTCSPGTHCCNASCGICVPPGGVCTQQICNPTE
jgi:hypothetical protein